MKIQNVIKSVGVATIFATMLIGCGSTKVVESTTPVSSKHVEREMIDWKGASIGSPVPEWVQSAIDGNKSAFTKMPQFENKIVFIAERTGKNLNALKSWTTNVNISGAFSKSLSDFVIAKFGGEATGSPDEKDEYNSYLQELTSTFSKMEINGMMQEMDYWVKTRIIDKDAKTTEDIYQYIVVYGMGKENFALQLDRALGKVEAKNQAQAQLKADTKSAMLEAQVFAESKLGY